ncbi:MAG: hypothetical protein EBV06_10420 [Planctomycetia bacterium]|nr:hypothetical protein [Planctomycetia bacterium]
MRITLVAAIVVAVGCSSSSEKMVTVSGTLLKDGKPYTFAAQKLPPGDPGFRLEFMKQDNGKDGEIFSADFKSDSGSFSVKGTKGPGVPVGKYKVILTKGAFGAPDEFKNAFSKEKTPLTADVPDSASVQLEIDLDKKTVTKK